MAIPCKSVTADAFESSAAKVEHFVVSTFTSVIPEPIRVKAREYWDAFKSKTQKEIPEEAGEKVEMAGWGVEEAQERHDEEASSFDLILSVKSTRLTWSVCRFGDAARPSVCYSQELLLCPHTTNGRGHSEGGQDLAILGLEHWKTHSQISLSNDKDQHRLTCPEACETPRCSHTHAHMQTHTHNLPHKSTSHLHRCTLHNYRLLYTTTYARIHCNTNLSINMDGQRLWGANTLLRLPSTEL